MPSFLLANFPLSQLDGLCKHMHCAAENCSTSSRQAASPKLQAPMQRACCALLSRSAACLRFPNLEHSKCIAARPARQLSAAVRGAATGGGSSAAGAASDLSSTAGAVSSPAMVPNNPCEQQQQGVQVTAGAQQQQQQQQSVGKKKQRTRARQVAAELRNGRPPLWWKDRPSYRCPACGQCCYKVPAFETHILRCCPDVALPDEWHRLLASAEAQQAAGPAAQQTAAGPAAEPAHEQEEQQRLAPAAGAGAAPQQSAAPDGSDSGSDGDATGVGLQRKEQQAPQALQLHPADAAIRDWLKLVEQREDEQRSKAVGACCACCLPWFDLAVCRQPSRGLPHGGVIAEAARRPHA